MNKCTHCLTENAESLTFCTRCGKKLPPSLSAFLQRHSLDDCAAPLSGHGITSLSDLLAVDTESLRSFLPYGHIIRLRKALQTLASAPVPSAVASQLEAPESPSTAGPRPPSPAAPQHPSSGAPVAPPASAPDWPRKVARNYDIMLWSIVTFGLAGLVGALLANFQLKKVGVTDDLAREHLRWQARTFALSFLWAVVLSVCGVLIFHDEKQQSLLPIFAWCWFYYRVLKGRSLLKKAEFVYRADPSRNNMVIGIACAASIAVAAIIGAFLGKDREGTKGDSVESDSAVSAMGNDSSLADIERQREEAEEEARRLRQTAAQAEREKEDALERARQFETAATAQVAPDASYGSSVLSFSDAKSRADSGEAYAQAVTSIYYATGYKAPKDIAMAAHYAILSAEQGHPLGIYRLGAMRQAGDGMPSDEQQGIQLKAKALPGLDRMVGDPYAMTALGIMLFRGENIAKDKSLAASLYKRAADMGYAPAQFTYSACLLSGQGTPKNEMLGLQYWQAAHQQSYPPALEGPPR